jgi:hypothetical protein
MGTFIPSYGEKAVLQGMDIGRALVAEQADAMNQARMNWAQMMQKAAELESRGTANDIIAARNLRGALGAGAFTHAGGVYLDPYGNPSFVRGLGLGRNYTPVYRR